MIHNIVGKDIKIKLTVGGAITTITTEPLNQNSVGTHKLYVYSDVMTGADIMLFAYFAKGDFNTGELFMQPIPSDKDGLNLWQLTIPATALKERGQWTLAVEIRQEVSYIVVTEGASETKTGYKRLAHGNINFTVQQSVVQDSIYPEQEVYTPEQDSQYENVVIILNEQSLTLNAHGDELERLEADKQDKVDERLDGLGGNDVVGAIIATKQAAENAQDNAGQALTAAQDAALVAGQASDAASEAKQTAEGIDGKATQAQQDAADALEQVVGKYVKPETGIPKTDLAAGVQTSLGKADTALQSESDPTVPSWAKAEDKPEYTAAEIAGLESITNLTNYYSKTETYTQTEVNNLISAIPKLTITVVTELPEVGDPTKIYVIGNKEYLWLADEERYEQFGDLSVDLSGYYDKDEVDALLADKVDKVADKGLSTEDYTTTEKTKLFNIAANAQVNVKSDWNAVSGDAEILNKPTIPSEQVNADWNASSGKGQILNKPAIPDAQIQSDWNQSNTGAKDYIKNKPTIPSPYTLPTASETVLGGVKVGSGLSIDDGVLSAEGGGGGGESNYVIVDTIEERDELTPYEGLICRVNLHEAQARFMTVDDVGIEANKMSFSASVANIEEDAADIITFTNGNKIVSWGFMGGGGIVSLTDSGGTSILDFSTTYPFGELKELPPGHIIASFTTNGLSLLGEMQIVSYSENFSPYWVYKNDAWHELPNLTTEGDGTKFLSDEGTYKEVNATTPQEVPSGTTLLPNVDYVKIPTANVTYTLGTPIPGIVNHYHLTWMNYTSGDAYRPAFSGVQIIWAEACGDPPTTVDGGTWLEFSIMYVREGSDYAYIGRWVQIK